MLSCSPQHRLEPVRIYWSPSTVRQCSRGTFGDSPPYSVCPSVCCSSSSAAAGSPCSQCCHNNRAAVECELMFACLSIFILHLWLTQVSRLAIWLTLPMGLMGTGWSPHNCSNLLSTLMSSDVWKIRKKPTVRTCSMISRITMTENCREGRNFISTLELINQILMLTVLINWLLSREAPRMPKMATSVMTIPAAMIMMPAMWKCSNWITMCSPMATTSSAKIYKKSIFSINHIAYKSGPFLWPAMRCVLHFYCRLLSCFASHKVIFFRFSRQRVVYAIC